MIVNLEIMDMFQMGRESQSRGFFEGGGRGESEGGDLEKVFKIHGFSALGLTK